MPGIKKELPFIYFKASRYTLYFLMTSFLHGSLSCGNISLLTMNKISPFFIEISFILLGAGLFLYS
ncbi:MAG: hypothetical protein JXB49_26415, partial [Bacteroidales bacterium]|nr:hypothetical protein [Bacteroidales bacterium]